MTNPIASPLSSLHSLSIPVASGLIKDTWQNLAIPIDKAEIDLEQFNIIRKSTCERLNVSYEPILPRTYFRIETDDDSLLFSIKNAALLLMNEENRILDALVSETGRRALSVLLYNKLIPPSWQKLSDRLTKIVDDLYMRKRLFNKIRMSHKEIFSNPSLYSRLIDNPGHFTRSDLPLALPIESGKSGEIYAILKLYPHSNPFAKGFYKKVYYALELHSFKLAAWSKMSLAKCLGSEKLHIQSYIDSEIQAYQNLLNPNIVKTFHHSIYGEKTGFMMELCNGDLGTLLEQEKKKIKLSFGQKDLWNIFEDTLNALVELENKGIHHRDIKPANIFIKQTKNGLRGKLGDFGFYITLEKEKIVLKSCGTPIFFSPEYKQGFQLIEEGNNMIKIGEETAKNIHFIPSSRLLEALDLTVIGQHNQEAKNLQKKCFLTIQKGKRIHALGIQMLATLKTDIWALGLTLYQMRTRIDPLIFFSRVFDDNFSAQVFYSRLASLTQKEVDQNFAQPIASDTLEELNRRMMLVDPRFRPSATECLKIVQQLRKLNVPFK